MRRIVLIASVALLCSGCKPKYLQQAMDAPVRMLYSRPAEDIHIPIHSPTISNGGLSDDQVAMLVDILNKLPAADTRLLNYVSGLPVKLPLGATSDGSSADATALYEPDTKGVVIDTSKIGGVAGLSDVFLHEMGHAVEYQRLSQPQIDAWNALHRASSDGDFVTDGAQDEDNPGGGGDDFAETFMVMATNSDAYWKMAVDAAAAGHPAILQKILFMSTLFANPDGTINFYTSLGNATQIPMAITHITYSVDRREYYRTATSLTIGNYTYRLEGSIITAIVAPNGDVIADHLSIQVPQIVFDSLRLTKSEPLPSGPRPLSDSPRDPCVPGCASSSVQASGKAKTALGFSSEKIISSQPPDSYTSLYSQDGYRAQANEQAMSFDPKRRPTVQDAIRPHGDFGVVIR